MSHSSSKPSAAVIVTPTRPTIKVPNSHRVPHFEYPVSPGLSANSQAATQPAVDLSVPRHISSVSHHPVCWGRLVPLDSQVLSHPILLTHTIFRIGRSSSSQLKINELTVSSKHCSLYYDEHKHTVCVVDQQSSNGTYVNSNRLGPDRRCYLAHGDVLSLVSGTTYPSVVDHDSGFKRVRLGEAENSRPSFAFIFHQVPPPLTFCAEAIRKAPLEFTAKFGLLEEIGRGNFATVYRAVCRTSGEEVAVKVIERSRFLNMTQDRFLDQVKEARVLAKIDHPGVVKFIDLIQTESALFVVMEMLKGGELFEQLANHGAYREDRARLLVRRIVEALSYLHDRGILHRDIKPENVVLGTSDVDAKLVDFGVAAELQGAELGRKTFCGSLSYVAPEVLKRRKKQQQQPQQKPAPTPPPVYGKGVDMWSLGVLIHILLSMTPPFNEEENSQMYESLPYVLEFDEAEWDHISSSAKDFIRQCLQVNQDHRITAHQALEHPWLANL